MEILHGDLAGLLHAPARERAQDRFRDHGTGLEEGEDGARVGFAEPWHIFG